MEQRGSNATATACLPFNMMVWLLVAMEHNQGAPSVFIAVRLYPRHPMWMMWVVLATWMCWMMMWTPVLQHS